LFFDLALAGFVREPLLGSGSDFACAAGTLLDASATVVVGTGSAATGSGTTGSGTTGGAARSVLAEAVAGALAAEAVCKESFFG